MPASPTTEEPPELETESVLGSQAGPLTLEEQRILLALARRAIEAVVTEGIVVPIDPESVTERLARPGASFVTLTIRGTGELRGCTGTIEAVEPLAASVRNCAIQTALYDYRFPPVAPAELNDIEIEISVLTEPERLEYATPEELLRILDERKPGVLIQRGAHRATFLPQVWERLPDAETFMAYLCAKAGLPPDDYRRPGLQVFTYQVEKFTESEAYPSSTPTPA